MSNTVRTMYFTATSAFMPAVLFLTDGSLFSYQQTQITSGTGLYSVRPVPL